PFLFNSGGYATLSFIPTLGTMILGLIAGGWLRGAGVSPAVTTHKPDAQARGSGAVPTYRSPLTPHPWQTVGALILAGLILSFLGLLAHGAVEIPFAKGWENVTLVPVSVCPCVKRIWTPSWTL